MMQTMTAEKEKMTWLVHAPEGVPFMEALQDACRGYERISKVLYHLLYLANYEAKRQSSESGQVTTDESGQVVTISVKHDDILRYMKENMRITLSEKSLIRYLEKLAEWKFISLTKYGRAYTLHIDTIQKSVDNPPAKPERPIYDRHPQKSGQSKKVDKLQLSTEEHDVVKFLLEKVDSLQMEVDNLQQKVDSLPLNVDKLQQKVVTLQLSNDALALELERLQEAKNESLIYKYNIQSNIPKEERESGATASADHASPYDFDFDLEDFTLQVVFEEWIAHQQTHTPAVTSPDQRGNTFSEQESAQNVDNSPEREDAPDPVGDTDMPVNATPSEKEDAQTVNTGKSRDHIAKGATGKEEVTNVIPLFPEMPIKGAFPSLPSTEEHPKETGKTPPKKSRYQISLQGQHIFDLYQQHKKRRLTLNEGNVRAANSLAEVVAEDQDLLDVVKEMEGDDYYKTHGMDLATIYRRYDVYFDKVCSKRAARGMTDSTQSSRLVASTPGSQYIVDAIEAATEAAFAAFTG